MAPTFRIVHEFRNRMWNERVGQQSLKLSICKIVFGYNKLQEFDYVF